MSNDPRERIRARAVGAARPEHEMIYRTIATLLHALFRLLFTLEYSGEENVPERGPVILAGNHPSYLDPVLIGIPLARRVYFMAWDQLFRVPLLGTVMRAFGAFPVRLGTRDPNAYAAARDVLAEGKALGIFPEAGRSKEGPMNPLKTGTARLAIETGAPIVPVTITGAFDAWPSSRRLPWPRKITVKYHEPIALEAAEVAARGGEKSFHEEITARLRASIERRLIPSLTADARKRRAFAGPPSPVRIYELYPLIAAICGALLGGPAPVLFGLAVAHAVYLAADIWWVRQGRLTKAARELATPAFAVALGPPLARTAGIEVPEWASFVALGAGVTLCFNWANRYKAERYARGALLAYFLSFALALGVPHPYAPQIAFAVFTAVYALGWRTLFWYVVAPVMLAAAAAYAWIWGEGLLAAAGAHAGLALLVALYVRFVKFSAHDGRMV